MKTRTSVICIFFCLNFLFGFAQAKLELQDFVSGLNQPVGIVNSGDERLFVLQQRGLISIISPNGDLMETPFLDLSSLVSQSATETGLLGLAFHPKYSDNGYFFVDYTRISDGATVISRFSRDKSNPDLADPASEKQLLTVSQPYANHNGGQLLFGPDGYLYIALGDGGSGGDPQNNAQNPSTYLGKILRINVDVQNDDIPYLIPPDNPFINEDQFLDEIWALGLRNPWRASFDRITGDLWIADVGQDKREEINFQAANSSGGENYGWRCYEASLEYNMSGCNDELVYTFPIFEYAHQGSGCSGSVTGGYIYRGARFNSLYGHYIFADYCTGNLYYLTSSNEGYSAILAANLPSFKFSAFGEDIYGELYVALREAGEIKRIIETDDCKPYALILNANESLEDGKAILLEALYHPSLNYQWIKNGLPLENQTDRVLLVEEPGNYAVEVSRIDKTCSNISQVMNIALIPTQTAKIEKKDIQINTFPTINTIEISDLSENIATMIYVIDLQGRIIKSLSEKNQNKIILNTDELPSGMFLIKVLHGTEMLVKKVLL